ncbi:hypothetical protein [Micromonospora sp. CPCC 206061]|uniref:hypothetical protein n=1 Tax=Micromonospora sp. CPCC 206061 TaxID=3122410 RepID=UPI002FF40CE8
MRTLRTVVLVTATPVLLAAVGLVHPHLLTAATADRWVTLHIVLLPVFPLLALGLVVPLWGRPARDAVGVATVAVWVGAFIYATFYTGLDTVAGVAAGTVASEAAGRAEVGASVQALFDTGDRLGYVGAYALGAATLAASVALFLRHGARTVPGSLLLLAASYSFVDSHIFWPRGVLTMVAFAAGFALSAVISTRSERHLQNNPKNSLSTLNRSRRLIG